MFRHFASQKTPVLLKKVFTSVSSTKSEATLALAFLCCHGNIKPSIQRTYTTSHMLKQSVSNQTKLYRIK